MSQFWRVMAVFRPNQGFLREQVASLIAQTCPDWCCVVVDDTGEPSQQNRVRELLFPDDRFHYVAHEYRRGSVKTFEAGLKLAPIDCDYICYCDQDDIWLPHKLDTISRFFVQSDAVMVHSDLATIGANGEPLVASLFHFERRILDHRLLYLAVKNVATGCTLAFRRRLLDEILPIPEVGLRPLYHHDLWTALHASINGGIGVIEEPLVLYRQHGGNQLGAQPPRATPQSPFGRLLNPLRLVVRARRRWRLHARIISDFLCSIANQGKQTARSDVRELQSWRSSRFPPHSMKELERELTERNDPAMQAIRYIRLGKTISGLCGIRTGRSVSFASIPGPDPRVAVASSGPEFSPKTLARPKTKESFSRPDDRRTHGK